MEIDGSWRHWLVLLVLAAWAIAGLLGAPPVLRRMARRESGSRVAARRELTDALGVHYQTVGYLERGEYSPSLYLALRISSYFEVAVEVIFSTDPFPRLGSAAADSATGRSALDPGRYR